MALQARLSVPITSAGDKVAATFEYIDSAAPAVVLAVESFTFPATLSAADMSSVIVARGQQLRAATVAATSLAAQFPPVTTVIAIP